MAFTRAAVGAKITSTMYNQLVDAFAAVGQVQIVPTAVTNGSVNSVGLVTWTNGLAASPLLIDGLFPAAYSDFIVKVKGSTSAGMFVTANLRAGGVTISSALYDRTETVSRNATVASTTTASATSWPLGGVANTLQKFTLDVSNVNVASPTSALMQGFTVSVPAVQNASNAEWSNALSHQGLFACDGLALTANANFTGSFSIQCFGVNGS